MEDTCQFTAGLILGNGENLDEGFLANVSKPHPAAVCEGREKEGVKQSMPRKKGNTSHRGPEDPQCLYCTTDTIGHGSDM